MKGDPFFFVINFEKTVAHVWPLSDIPEDIWISFPNWTNHPVRRKPAPLKSILTKYPIAFEDYDMVFQNVVNEINKGNSYLANLTFKTPINLTIGFDEIYHNSRSRYTMKFRDEFIVFSPETFLRIEAGKIYASPMKGTINANVPEAETVLLNNKKEESEHFTIVDLIRNDLSLISKNVKVERFRYVEKVKSESYDLLQTSTLISGELPEDYRKTLGDRIFTVLPAGSVSGAPKKETVRILKQHENYDRGFYTGVMGLFDGHTLDSAVMIRYIERAKQGLFFKSGGGVTSLSDSKTEYQELIDKVYVPVY